MSVSGPQGSVGPYNSQGQYHSPNHLQERNRFRGHDPAAFPVPAQGTWHLHRKEGEQKRPTATLMELHQRIGPRAKGPLCFSCYHLAFAIYFTAEGLWGTLVFMCAAERRFRDDSVVMRRQHPTASNSISRWFTESVKTASQLVLFD